MDYKQRYEEWVQMLPEGDPLKDELLAIKDNDNEIKERFYQNLAFVMVINRFITTMRFSASLIFVPSLRSLVVTSQYPFVTYTKRS